MCAMPSITTSPFLPKEAAINRHLVVLTQIHPQLTTNGLSQWPCTCRSRTGPKKRRVTQERLGPAKAALNISGMGEGWGSAKEILQKAEKSIANPQGPSRTLTAHFGFPGQIIKREQLIKVWSQHNLSASATNN